MITWNGFDTDCKNEGAIFTRLISLTGPLREVIGLFQGLNAKDVKRPVGEINVLIGFEYAGFHPIREQYSDHLLALKNQFWRCL